MPVQRNLSDLAADARQRVPEITVDDLRRRIDSGDQPVIVDVREPAETAHGSLPGAVNVPRGVLERDVEKVCFDGSASEADLERTIVCYCGGGSRSVLAADQLRKMGFRNALSLAGGYKAWSERAST